MQQQNLETLDIKSLKALIESKGGDPSYCLEKSDLVRLAKLLSVRTVSSPPNNNNPIDKKKQDSTSTSTTFQQLSSQNVVHDKKFQTLALFWDIENLPVPKGVDIRSLIPLIRERCGGTLLDEIRFDAFGDITRIPKSIQLELERVGVQLINVASARKNAADFRISQAVNDHVRVHSNTVVVLLSADGDFLDLANSLRRNPTIKSILIHAHQVSFALVEAFDVAYEWPSLQQTRREEKPIATPKGNTFGMHQPPTTARSTTTDPPPVSSSLDDGFNRLNYLPNVRVLNTASSIGTGQSSVFVYWKCSVCDTSFFSNEALAQHHQVTGHNMNWECEECSKQFKSENALTQHQDATGHGVWECSECMKTFASEHALQQHEEATGHSWYPCPVCNRVFDSLESLHQHQRALGHFYFR
jgi:hypothetical protein